MGQFLESARLDVTHVTGDPALWFGDGSGVTAFGVGFGSVLCALVFYTRAHGGARCCFLSTRTGRCRFAARSAPRLIAVLGGRGVPAPCPLCPAQPEQLRA